MKPSGKTWVEALASAAGAGTLAGIVWGLIAVPTAQPLITTVTSQTTVSVTLREIGTKPPVVKVTPRIIKTASAPISTPTTKIEIPAITSPTSETPATETSIVDSPTSEVPATPPITYTMCPDGTWVIVGNNCPSSTPQSPTQSTTS